MLEPQLCRSIYEYFHQKIYNARSTSSRNLSNQDLIVFCIQELQKRYGSVGGQFLWFYVIYQFGRFSKVNFIPNSFTKEVGIPNVFGKRAVSQFFARRVDLDSLTRKASWIQINNISQADFTNITQINLANPAIKISIQSNTRVHLAFRSPIKATACQFDFALDFCKEETDLYNKLDPSCQRCPQKKECRVLLEEIYPHLFKIKG